MKSHDARNLIVTLIIVAVGVKLLLSISDYYASRAGSAGQFSELIQAFASLGNFAIYGLIILAILLIPYYLSKRSEEKKMPSVGQ